MMTIALLLIASYLIGSIPTGYLIGRVLKGVDIRTVGSMNPGATNVFRSVGRGAGIATLLIDMAKGFVPVALAANAGWGEWILVASAFMAVAGHTWPVWLGFNGGKGVATSAGALFALLPGPTGWTLIAFAVALAVSRRVSVGSILGSIVLPVAAFATAGPSPRSGLAALLGVLVFLKHIPNIRRLARGEEPPLRFSRPADGEGGRA